MDNSVNPCLSCVSSCCKLEVDITKDEHTAMLSNGLGYGLTARADTFIDQYPQYEDKREHVVNMFGDNYATIDKADSGFCVFLDPQTRLCTVYDHRPSVCVDYQNNTAECKKIRKCI